MPGVAPYEEAKDGLIMNEFSCCTPKSGHYLVPINAWYTATACELVISPVYISACRHYLSLSQYILVPILAIILIVVISLHYRTSNNSSSNMGALW